MKTAIKTFDTQPSAWYNSWMSTEQEEMKKAASLFAKMGGKANVAKHGKDHMKRISQLGVQARKRNKAKSAPISEAK